MSALATATAGSRSAAPKPALGGHQSMRIAGRQVEIVAVATLAPQQPGILDAQDRCADAGAVVGIAGRQDCLVD